MVAESPNAPFCTADATAYRRKQMLAARDKVRICSQARIVGVVFWDRPHSFTGRAPNAIELHRSSTSPACPRHENAGAIIREGRKTGGRLQKMGRRVVFSFLSRGVASCQSRQVGGHPAPFQPR
jgi:hypothetical protein